MNYSKIICLVLTISNLSSFFPTYLGLHQNINLVEEVKEYIIARQIGGIQSGCAPNIKKNLVESDFDLFADSNESIQKLVNYFSSCLTKTINDIHKEKISYRLVYNESWFHIGKKNSVHELHMHAGCSWCGIYYIQAGEEGSGETVFINPITQQYSDFGNRYLLNNYNIKVHPKDGYLVLFPSYLPHYQSLYIGDINRIVVSFNCSVYPLMTKQSNPID